MQEGFPFYLMIGIRYTTAAAAPWPTMVWWRRLPSSYDVFIEAEARLAELAN